jgi:hypothetical protein
MSELLGLTGIVTDPVPGNAKLEAGVVLRVVIQSVTSENDGIMETVIGKDGKSKQLPALSQNFMVRCVYPDGSVKHHQVKDADELKVRINTNMRGKYGLAEVPFIATPERLAEGEEFLIGEMTDGE